MRPTSGTRVTHLAPGKGISALLDLAEAFADKLGVRAAIGAAAQTEHAWQCRYGSSEDRRPRENDRMRTLIAIISQEAHHSFT